jgi:hypothetical protein
MPPVSTCAILQGARRTIRFAGMITPFTHIRQPGSFTSLTTHSLEMRSIQKTFLGLSALPKDRLHFIRAQPVNTLKIACCKVMARTIVFLRPGRKLITDHRIFTTSTIVRNFRTRRHRHTPGLQRTVHLKTFIFKMEPAVVVLAVMMSWTLRAVKDSTNFKTHFTIMQGPALRPHILRIQVKVFLQTMQPRSP